MRTGYGLDGQILKGWDHIRQSILLILTTRINTRTIRRHLGSKTLELQDEKMSARNLLTMAVSAHDAINPDNIFDGEPGFRLDGVEIAQMTRTGRVCLLLIGREYPNGHQGDWTISNDRTLTLTSEELS